MKSSPTEHRVFIRVEGAPDYTPDYQGAKTIVPSEAELHYDESGRFTFAKFSGPQRKKDRTVSTSLALITCMTGNREAPQWLKELAEKHNPVAVEYWGQYGIRIPSTDTVQAETLGNSHDPESEARARLQRIKDMSPDAELVVRRVAFYPWAAVETAKEN